MCGCLCQRFQSILLLFEDVAKQTSFSFDWLAVVDRIGNVANIPLTNWLFVLKKTYNTTNKGVKLEDICGSRTCCRSVSEPLQCVWFSLLWIIEFLRFRVSVRNLWNYLWNYLLTIFHQIFLFLDGVMDKKNSSSFHQPVIFFSLEADFIDMMEESNTICFQSFQTELC